MAAKAAGINFWIVELIAAYSPPIPAPVKRNRKNVKPREASQRRRRQIDRDGDEKERPSRSVSQPKNRAPSAAPSDRRYPQGRPPDRKNEARDLLSSGADGSRRRRFEPVEDPGGRRGRRRRGRGTGPMASARDGDPRGDNASRCVAAEFRSPSTRS